jgi:hypothetical protein
MGKSKSIHYRVDKILVDNPKPPPPKIYKYAVLDRLTMKHVSVLYDDEKLAAKECQRLNALTP